MSVRFSLATLCAWAGFCVLAFVLARGRPGLETHETARRLAAVATPTRGFVISMDNETGWLVGAALQDAFQIADMQVVVGHVGNASGVTLYGRHLMRHGRSDSLQIGNLNMLGCLESHREVWTRVEEDSYVFEHDAVAAQNALGTVRRVLHDVAQTQTQWSVIQLQRGGGSEGTHSFFADAGQYTRVGEITRTCRDCVSYGTRGYIVRPDAARMLLEHYDPPTVQVDAYMSLMSAYTHGFRQVWTTVQAVDWIPQPSTVQDTLELLLVHGASSLGRT